MLYHYSASNPEGVIVEGEHDAANVEEALRYLSGMELTPLSVEAIGEERKQFLRGKITFVDRVFLIKHLALMLKVGTDLLSAVNILITDFEKPAVRSFLLEIREGLSKGRPFHESFAHHPRIFSPVFVNLVKAAEASGKLQETFEQLSVALEKEAELRNKVRAAFIYPIVVLTASLAVFMFLTTFAIPRIANVFTQGGIEPPLFSRVVFGVGLFFGKYVWVILGGLLILAIASYFFFFRTVAGRRFIGRVAGKTPLIKNLYHEIEIQRFSSTFGTLLGAGIPIIDAVKIVAEVMGSEEFHAALVRVADEGLAKGQTVGEAFRAERAFPRVVTNLIAISERAGHLEEVLSTIGDFYASRVDARIKELISFLEPALLLFMGVLVGGIALSIILPIYQLTSQF